MFSAVLFTLGILGAYASVRKARGKWLIGVLLIWSVAFRGLSLLVLFVLPR